MGIFKQNPFSKASASLGASSEAATNQHLATISSGYRRLLRDRPFLAFGLPFMATIVAGSFFLTPVAAVRYEKFDRKTHTIDHQQAVGMGFKNLQPGGSQNQASMGQTTQKDKKAGARFKNKDIREEYWKLAGQNDKLDDWEPKRVKRLPGEPDGTFD